jgi:tRNA (guanine-N7-)-methyltransferase
MVATGAGGGGYAGGMADLSRGRTLDAAPGVVGIAAAELPPLPDDLLARPTAGRLDLGAWFRNPGARLELEIGTGKGTFILNQAAADPETNYLGIEWEGEIYAYCADRIRRRGLSNVRMLHADAVSFLRWRVHDGAFAVIHLYYSDPWPKTKHHKNRVVQHGFLAEAWRTLAAGGELRVVTDHDELWAWDREHFAPWLADAASLAAGLAAGMSDPVPAGIRAAVGGGPAFSEHEFVPPAWVDDGEVLGTNYERKFCGPGGAVKAPHSCVLRKRG